MLEVLGGASLAEGPIRLSTDSRQGDETTLGSGPRAYTAAAFGRLIQQKRHRYLVSIDTLRKDEVLRLTPNYSRD